MAIGTGKHLEATGIVKKVFAAKTDPYGFLLLLTPIELRGQEATFFLEDVILPQRQRRSLRMGMQLQFRIIDKPQDHMKSKVDYRALSIEPLTPAYYQAVVVRAPAANGTLLRVALDLTLEVVKISPASYLALNLEEPLQLGDTCTVQLTWDEMISGSLNGNIVSAHFHCLETPQCSETPEPTTNDSLMSENDSSMPANDNSVLEKDNSVPANDNSVPAKDKSVPANGNSVPANGNSVAAKDNSMTASGSSMAAKIVHANLGQELRANNIGQTVVIREIGHEAGGAGFYADLPHGGHDCYCDNVHNGCASSASYGPEHCYQSQSHMKPELLSRPFGPVASPCGCIECLSSWRGFRPTGCPSCGPMFYAHEAPPLPLPIPPSLGFDGF